MVSEIFPVENIVVDLESEDKDEVFEELVEVLHSAQPATDRAEVLGVLRERESKMTTGIMPGIAVPHAISTTVKGIVGVVGISRKGIDYEALDGKPVHLIFMLLFSVEARVRHLQVMKELAELLSVPEFYSELMNKKSSREVFKAMCDFEQSLEDL